MESKKNGIKIVLVYFDEKDNLLGVPTAPNKRYNNDDNVVWGTDTIRELKTPYTKTDLNHFLEELLSLSLLNNQKQHNRVGYWIKYLALHRRKSPDMDLVLLKWLQRKKYIIYPMKKELNIDASFTPIGSLSIVLNEPYHDEELAEAFIQAMNKVKKKHLE